MKTMIFLLLSIVVLSSCSTGFVDEEHTHCDKELRPFYDSFMAEVKSRGLKLYRPEVGLSVHSGPLPSSRAGWTNYDQKEVTITDAFVRADLGHSYNNHVDSMEIQYIVYHELAHYFLNREHLPDTIFTIMTRAGSYQLDYMRNPSAEKELNNELFTLRK